MKASIQLPSLQALVAVAAISFMGATQTSVSAQRTNLPPRTPGYQAPRPNPKPPSPPIVVDQPTFSRPDLVIRKFQQNGNVQISGGFLRIPVKVAVLNQGQTDASQKTVCAVRVGSKHPWSTFMNPIKRGTVAEKTGIVSVKYSPAIQAAGKVVINAVADAAIGPKEVAVSPTGRVLESNEQNNQQALTINLNSGGGINRPGQRPPFPGGKTPGKPPRAKSDLLIDRFELNGNVRHTGTVIEIPFRMHLRNAGSSHTGVKSLAAINHANQTKWHSFISALGVGQKQIATGVLKINDSKKLYAGKTL
ncbi:MAG: hypothetical protein AAGA30_17165, partial [Planctomycetota bacterium]